MYNAQKITGALLTIKIDTKQAHALDAILGLMQAGFQAAIDQGEMERLAATKHFDEKFLALIAVDVFLNVVTDRFNELDEESLPKDDDGKPYASVDIETDDFTVLAIYNLTNFAEEKSDFLSEFEVQAPGLKFSNLAPLHAETIKLLDIKPTDKAGPVSFTAPTPKKEFLN